jgi:glutathione S-transferase
MEAALADADYLVDNRFTVTDIIAGYTVNWARRRQLIEDFPNLQAYRGRLLEREHCPLVTD